MHCGPSTYPSNGCNTNVAVGIALLRSIEGSEFPIGFFICLALAPAWPPCPTQGSEFVICFSCDLPRFGAGLAPDNIGVARLISEGSEFVMCFSKDAPRFGANAPKTSATRVGSERGALPAENAQTSSHANGDATASSLRTTLGCIIPSLH